MSALWLVPLLVGVVAICVVGVLDTLVHQANERVRHEADAIAALARTARSLAADVTIPERPGSGARPHRH